MIGIIGALDVETNELKEKLTNVKIETISGIDFFSGSFNEKNVVVAKCGVGKVFASMCAEIMILKYKPDKIIHIGIAGALHKDLKIKDVAIANDVVQHDFDFESFGMKKGQIQGIDVVKFPCSESIVKDLVKCAEKLGINYKVGTIASGDQFIESAVKKNSIVEDFDAIAVEMEGASTGQVCYVNGVDFAVVRSISDGSDEDAITTYNDSRKHSSDVSTLMILEYLSL